MLTCVFGALVVAGALAPQAPRMMAVTINSASVWNDLRIWARWRGCMASRSFIGVTGDNKLIKDMASCSVHNTDCLSMLRRYLTFANGRSVPLCNSIFG